MRHSHGVERNRFKGFGASLPVEVRLFADQICIRHTKSHIGMVLVEAETQRGLQCNKLVLVIFSRIQAIPDDEVRYIDHVELYERIKTQGCVVLGVAGAYP